MGEEHNDAIEESGKIFKWLQSIIALVIVVAGIGITWGVTTSRLNSLEDRIDKLEETFKDHKSDQKEETKGLQDSILELQLSKAANDQILRSIQQTLEEIRIDVKTIKENK